MRNVESTATRRVGPLFWILIVSAAMFLAMMFAILMLIAIPMCACGPEPPPQEQQTKSVNG